MQVDIPDVGTVDFPDSMSHEDVANVIKLKIVPQVKMRAAVRPNWNAAHAPGGVADASEKSTVLGGTLQGMGQDVLQAFSQAAGRPDVFPQPAPTTTMGALHNAGVNTLEQAFHPGNYLLPGAFEAVTKLAGPLAAKVGLAALATPGIAQAAGQLSPGSGATGPEKTQAVAQAAPLLLGAAPLAGELAKLKSSPVPSPDPLAQAKAIAAMNERGKVLHQLATQRGELTPAPVLPEKGGPAPFEKGKVLPNTPAPVRTLMDAQAARLRHDLLPWIEPADRAKIVQYYTSTGDIAGAEAQAQALRQQKLNAEVASAKQRKANASSQEQPKAAPPVPQGGEQGSQVSPPKEALQKPGDVGQNGGGPREGDRQGDEGLLKSPAAKPGLVQTLDRTQLKPALLVGGKPVTGGKSHLEIFNGLREKAVKAGDADALGAALDSFSADKNHVFVGPGGEVFDRETGAKAVGQTEPLHSHHLQEPVAGLTQGQVGQVRDAMLGTSTPLPKRQGEAGFFRLGGGSDISPLGMKPGIKVDPVQAYNRIRNVLGAESGAFKYMDENGLKDFLKVARTPEDLTAWLKGIEPKVEVKKFGVGLISSKQKEYNELLHWLDTNEKIILVAEEKAKETPGYFDFDNKQKRAVKYTFLPPDFKVKMERINDLKQELQGPGGRPVRQSGVHWSFVAPKAERDMPGYVEIAVVRPSPAVKGKPSDFNREHGAGYQPNTDKFPSSHSFPPNTLGFVRGYMETDPQTGEKTFHVIEVQSDIVKKADDGVYYISGHPELGKFKRPADAWKVAGNLEPLSEHYQRLALKAAIDHAKAEGATRIAVSDAETAMMSEGHDRAYDGPDADPAEYQAIKVGTWEPSQAPGMRLHYDQTLPKILGELTGEKGQRVGFGEHEKAYLADSSAEYQGEHEPEEWVYRHPQTGEIQRWRGSAGSLEQDEARAKQLIEKGFVEYRKVPRSDLIFRNPDGTPKTSVTARSFPLAKVDPSKFSTFGKDKPVGISANPGDLSAKRPGEAGFIAIPQSVTDALGRVGDDLRSFYQSIGPGSRVFFNRLRGRDLPHTAATSEDLANRLYMYAQADAVSQVMAHADPTTVLGDHYNDPAFSTKLGKTLVEYNLRATGNTTVGRSWGFKTDAEYQAALADPEIQAAIDRHAATVLTPAEARHQNLGGKLIKLDDPRMYINLKYVPQADELGQPGNPPVNPQGAAKGALLKATLQRKAVFQRQRKGTAEEYVTDYRALASRMVKANYAEDLRQKLNKEYVDKGLGMFVGPGEPKPEGMLAVPVKVQRVVLTQEGEANGIVNQDKDLYIRKDLMPEYLQAMQANIRPPAGALRKAADILTKLQVSAGVDAVQHTINMASAVNGAVRANIGKNLVGAKEIDTIAQITKNLTRVWEDKPEIQHLLSEMAKQYGIAREEHTYEGLFGGKSKAGEWLRMVDQAGRVTLFEIAKDLAAKGLIKNDPVLIREFVNKQLGQYNLRLMSAMTQLAKTTFSPFVVAGKTFNRLAMTRLLLSPQIRAANLKAWATMRARQALYVASALVIVPAVMNYALHGDVKGKEGARLGEIDLGPDEKGQERFFDMAKWTLIRRGLRITGAQSLMEGKGAGQAFTDVVRGVAAPYAGPLPNAASTLLRGKSALGYEAREPGEHFPYFKAAGRQLNPMAGSMMQSDDQGRGKMAGVLDRAAQMAGLRTSKDVSVIRSLARQFNYKQGKAQETDFAPSEYIPLLNALDDKNYDVAKEEYQKLTEGRKEKVIEQYFKNYATKRFTGNKEREAEFVAQLTPHQKDLYDKALAHEKELAEAFFEKVIKKPFPSRQKGFGNFGGFNHF